MAWVHQVGKGRWLGQPGTAYFRLGERSARLIGFLTGDQGPLAPHLPLRVREDLSPGGRCRYRPQALYLFRIGQLPIEHFGP
jgi:hypothetical protein